MISLKQIVGWALVVSIALFSWKIYNTSEMALRFGGDQLYEEIGYWVMGIVGLTIWWLRLSATAKKESNK
jgi:hypothetical protein